MLESTIVSNIDEIKQQLTIEIARYQAEIYLRQATIQALDVFDNSDTVNNWLQEQNSALDGVAPIELLTTPEGLARVIELLERSKAKLDRLKQRIEIMEQTAISPEDIANFQEFVEILNSQRSEENKVSIEL